MVLANFLGWASSGAVCERARARAHVYVMWWWFECVCGGGEVAIRSYIYTCAVQYNIHMSVILKVCMSIHRCVKLCIYRCAKLSIHCCFAMCIYLPLRPLPSLLLWQEHFT